MEIKYLSIGVKNSSLEEIKDALKKIGINDSIFTCLNDCVINLMDLNEEYINMSKFLKENDLKDETLFFNEFDMNPYGLRIDFEWIKDLGNMDILEPVVFILAQKLSSILNTECIAMYANNTIPAGLFSNGELIDSYKKYNLDFFKNRAWSPFW